MIENPSEQTQGISLTEQQSTDETISITAKKPAPILLMAVGFLLICALATGYLLSQSNQPSQPVTPTQSPTVQSSATPTVSTNSATVQPSSSPQPTASTQPVATKKPVQPKPTPTPITGVDVRFSDVHFNGQPEPNKSYTPFRVANGGTITVPNEKNDSEFKLFAVYANHGSEGSNNVWVHYFVDGAEVKKGLANMPGNMVADELVTTDSAQPVMIPASGSHSVKIVIDPENESKDVNVANNTYTFTYTVK